MHSPYLPEAPSHPFPPLQVITERQAELPVSDSSFPLASYFTHGMEEPCSLQSMGSQGVGHNLASKQQYRIYMESRKMALIYLCEEQKKRH